MDEELPVIDGLEQQKLQGSEEVLARFLASISLSADRQAIEDGVEKQCITISTIHAAKGLEWPVVFVPAVYEGSIPHSRAEDTDEERRLLYVAMTRAQALLYLSVPKRQSRDNAEETMLSQFLPPALRRRFWEVGPDFTDRVVTDVAGILRRDDPSQEQLLSGMQSLPAECNTKDDIWPADGSSKLPRYWNNDAAQPRQNFQGFRKLGGLKEGIPESQGDNDTVNTTSAGPGFTTAAQHFRSMPAAAMPISEKSLSGTHQARGHIKTTEVKRKNVKSGPAQARLNTFFTQGYFRSAVPQVPVGTTPNVTRGTRDFSEPALPELPPARNGNSIPQELLSHSIASTTVALKRPRPVLEQITPNKKHYYQFSSSPLREEHTSDMKSEVVLENGKSVARVESLGGCTQTFTKKATAMITYKGYSTTAYEPATTSMEMLQHNTTGRKTYGARRTLNSGWDARKHK